MIAALACRDSRRGCRSDGSVSRRRLAARGRFSGLSIPAGTPCCSLCSSRRELWTRPVRGLRRRWCLGESLGAVQAYHSCGMNCGMTHIGYCFYKNIGGGEGIVRRLRRLTPFGATRRLHRLRVLSPPSASAVLAPGCGVVGALTSQAAGSVQILTVKNVLGSLRSGRLHATPRRPAPEGCPVG